MATIFLVDARSHFCDSFTAYKPRDLCSEPDSKIGLSYHFFCKCWFPIVIFIFATTVITILYIIYVCMVCIFVYIYIYVASTPENRMTIPKRCGQPTVIAKWLLVDICLWRLHPFSWPDYASHIQRSGTLNTFDSVWYFALSLSLDNLIGYPTIFQEYAITLEYLDHEDAVQIFPRYVWFSCNWRFFRDVEQNSTCSTKRPSSQRRQGELPRLWRLQGHPNLWLLQCTAQVVVIPCKSWFNMFFLQKRTIISKQI